jgi:hypothetical protein
MVSLGDSFPVALRRVHVEEALKPGCVVRLEIKFPNITKPKFLILVATDDPEYLTFIVNSEIHPFIQSKPHLLQCQVSIDAASHDFLDYDSHVACHETLPIRREDVIKALVADPSSIKGTISSDVRAQVVAAVKFAKTLDNDKKKRIIESLD